MIRVEEIANKDFKSVIWGYDPVSVDAYLDEIITLILQMQAERKEMVSTIDYLVAELAAAGRKPEKEGLTEQTALPISPHELTAEKPNAEE
ncbi:MAG: DivIVA domain-containing protein [Clostridia bacterium]|nr:DivIVA domain-containing protein [Clostridia bacterium]